MKIAISLIIDYGVNIPTTCGKVQERVKSTIEKTFTVIDSEAAYLDSLSVSDGTNEYISNFSKTKYEYEINLSNTVEKVTVKAISNSCTVENGDSEIVLEKGETKSFTIFVISKNNPDKSNSYKLTISRASDIASNDARLLDLKLTDNNAAIIALPFTMDTTDYSLNVPYETNSVTMTFVFSHDKAKADVASGKVYSLKEGENVLSVKVTAEDGVTTKTYTVKIIRESSTEPVNANLKSLSVAGKSVSVSDYMTFSSSDSSVRVIATAEKEEAIVKINDKSVTGIDVPVPSTVNIEITDGTATKFYVLDIKKVSSAALTSLTVNGKNVPVNTMMSFISETETAEITATVNEETASFTIDGVAAVSGTASSVVISADGKTATKAIKIVLTSKDGTAVNYELSVNYNEVIKDKIVLHAYDWTHCYAWTGSSNALLGQWPGKAMTKEGTSKWYGITLDVTSVNIVFNNNGNGQTDDLSIKEAGEYWYKNKQWYDYNPDDTESPVVAWNEPSANSMLSNVVTLSVIASDNVGISKIEFYLDGTKLIATAENGATSISWDSANAANGTHTLKAIAYDAVGNHSETASVTIKTQNQNKAPVANAGGDKTGVEGVNITFDGSKSTDNGEIVSYATLAQTEVAYEDPYGTFIQEPEYAERFNGLTTETTLDETFDLEGGVTFTETATKICWNAIKEAANIMNGEVE